MFLAGPRIHSIQRDVDPPSLLAVHAVAAYIALAAAACYILTLDARRKYRSAPSPYAPRKRQTSMENACCCLSCLPPADTCLAPSRSAPLRAPWAAVRAPCPMPIHVYSKPPELTQKCACTLSATTLISCPLPRHAVPPRDASRAITNALPHHLFWGSHAQATRCVSSLPAPLSHPS